MRSCQDWSCVCYTRDGERRAVPQNDETSQKCGVYKSDCCWAEIVINGDYRSPSVQIYGREGAALETMLEEMMSPSFAVIAGKRADSRKLVTKRPFNSQ